MTATATLPTTTATNAPSAYQQAIYDFVLEDNRNAFVDACPGSGKTTVLVGIANRLPIADRQSALFCSFGKAIAEELGRRLPAGVKSSTINSAAYGALRYFVKADPKTWRADTRKYQKLVAIWFKALNVQTGIFADTEVKEEMEAITSLIHKVMVTLTDPKDMTALKALAIYFDLIIPDWNRAQGCVTACLNWGWNGIPHPEGTQTFAITETFDFAEQVYWCAIKPIRPFQYRFILVDEAQDLSAAQLEFLLKLCAPGGRFVFVGDRSQAIYCFAGSDAQSFEIIPQRTNAVRFSLPVCYRCPESHVELAAEFDERIQAAPGARPGVVHTIKDDFMVEDINSIINTYDHIMVLCRTCAPLISQAYELIAAGIPARVRGKEIGTQLTKIVDAVEKMEGYSFTTFVKDAEEWLERQLHNLRQQSDTEMMQENLRDRVESLIAVHAYVTGQREIRDAADLRVAIEELFIDEDRCKVVCSTIHKAKGLESEAVYIIKPELMPHPKAIKPHFAQQERNLQFVAYTRSKRLLVFVETTRPQ